jgi:mannosyl-oligosaccharide alpha-1,2-mannosidase
MELARGLMKTYRDMCAVTETGLAPEITWFNAADVDLQSRAGGRLSQPIQDSLA